MTVYGWLTQLFLSYIHTRPQKPLHKYKLTHVPSLSLSPLLESLIGVIMLQESRLSYWDGSAYIKGEPRLESNSYRRKNSGLFKLGIFPINVYIVALWLTLHSLPPICVKKHISGQALHKKPYFYMNLFRHLFLSLTESNHRKKPSETSIMALFCASPCELKCWKKEEMLTSRAPWEQGKLHLLMTIM